MFRGHDSLFLWLQHETNSLRLYCKFGKKYVFLWKIYDKMNRILIRILEKLCKKNVGG